MRNLLKNMPLLTLSALLAALFGMAACGGDGESGCSNNQHKCDDGQCHECCANTDCSGGEQCGADYKCAAACLEANGDCSSDPEVCCDGLACDPFTAKCMTACTEHADCQSRNDVDFADALQCTAGKCDFQHCSNDKNCRPDTVCYNGDCVKPADCDQVSSCTVVPAYAVTKQGAGVTFSASAFLSSGALAPGVNFSWASDDSAIAAAAAGGVVTGGANTGEATITATVSGCATTCTATVRNYGAVTAGHTRVIVVDEALGTPVAGATVTIVGGATTTTDANGVADFNTTLANDDISVIHADYTNVTLANISESNLIVHVGKFHDTSKSGGYKGKFDLSKVPCLPEGCEVEIGLTGPSIPGTLFNLNLDLLVGEMIKTTVTFTGKEFDLDLPGGLVLGLAGTWFKETFSPTGAPGNRVIWGLGGKAPMNDVVEALGPVLAGGDTSDMNMGDILVQLLPMFARFYSGMVPNFDINPIAKVLDVNDLNGDGETTDYVPDYANFPSVPGGSLTLKVPMDREVTVKLPAMPSNGQGGYLYDSALVIAGVVVRDAGLVPLGISAGLDVVEEGGTADGHIDDVTVAVADVAGRLPEDQFDRVVVVLVLNLASAFDSGDDPLLVAGQVFYDEVQSGFDVSLTVPTFMEPPVVSYNTTTLQANVTSVPASTDYLHLLYMPDEAPYWQLLSPKTTGTIDLPVGSTGFTADGMNLVAIELADSLDYAGLVQFNDHNMDSLVKLAKSFVLIEATKQ